MQSEDLTNKYTVLIAVYGSLKKGFWNYDSFLKNNSEFVGTATVRGTLTLPHSYPYLFAAGTVLGGIHDHDVDVELYKVSANTYNGIHNMEIGAGYTAEFIKTEYGTAKIFYTKPWLFNDKQKLIDKYE